MVLDRRTRGRSAAAGIIGAIGLALAVTLAVSPAQAVRTIVPAETAQAKVTRKVPGQVISVARTRRDGFRSWAVTVQRRDGSVVVGYVDIASGIIFDWTVQRRPGEPVVDLDGPAGGLTPAKPPASPVMGTTTPEGSDPNAAGDSDQDDPAGTTNSPTSPASPTSPQPSADDAVDPDAPSEEDPSDDDPSDEDPSDEDPSEGDSSEGDSGERGDGPADRGTGRHDAGRGGSAGQDRGPGSSDGHSSSDGQSSGGGHGNGRR